MHTHHLYRIVRLLVPGAVQDRAAVSSGTVFPLLSESGLSAFFLRAARGCLGPRRGLPDAILPLSRAGSGCFCAAIMLALLPDGKSFRAGREGRVALCHSCPVPAAVHHADGLLSLSVPDLWTPLFAGAGLLRHGGLGLRVPKVLSGETHPPALRGDGRACRLSAVRRLCAVRRHPDGAACPSGRKTGPCGPGRCALDGSDRSVAVRRFARYFPENPSEIRVSRRTPVYGVPGQLHLSGSPDSGSGGHGRTLFP